MIPWHELEAPARALVEHLVGRSLAGALVLGVALALWLPLRRRLAPAWVAAWFLVPLAVLALPLERALPDPWPTANPVELALVEGAPGLGRLLLDPWADAAPADAGATGVTGTPSGASPAAEASVAARAATAGPGGDPHGAGAPAPSVWPLALAGAWLAGALALGLAFLRSQVRVLGLLRRADRPSAEVLRRMRPLLGRRRVILLETDELGSPATWGLGRRVLLLPRGLADRLGPTELAWVVEHELCHLGRLDHLVDLGQRLVAIAFFFHPGVWLANRLVRSHRELACDAGALARCAPARGGAGARALLEVAAHASGHGPRPAHAMVSLLDDKTLLRNRLMNLTDRSSRTPNRPRLLALTGFGLASLVALAPAQFQGLAAEPPPQAPPLDLVAERRAEARAALERGLAWLLATQAEDGGWHDTQTPLTGVEPIRPYFDDLASTALAALALARHAERWPDPPAALGGRDATLGRALAHLVAAQDPETGLVGGRDSWVYLVRHALATEALARGLALAEAHAAAGGALPGPAPDALRASLEAAVHQIVRARNPYAGWRYDDPPRGDNDAMQTGRMLLALGAAAEVGVTTDRGTLRGGESFLREVHDEATGRTGYMSRGDHALRILERQDEFPADKAEAPTALHLVLRLAEEDADPAGLSRAVGVVLAAPPVWSRALGTTDLNYWMHGTRAMAAVGGTLAELWNDALLEALLPHQLRDGEDAGAWPGADAWSAPGLRTYTTASACRALLEVVAAP